MPCLHSTLPIEDSQGREPEAHMYPDSLHRQSITRSPAVKEPTGLRRAAKASTAVSPADRMNPCPAFSTAATFSVATAACWYPDRYWSYSSTWSRHAQSSVFPVAAAYWGSQPEYRYTHSTAKAAGLHGCT